MRLASRIIIGRCRSLAINFVAASNKETNNTILKDIILK